MRVLIPLRIVFVLAIGWLATRALAGAVATPDEQARFLAGLPVRGTPLEPVSLSPSWAVHASELDAAWKNLERRQLAPIRAWAPASLGEAFTARGPLYYMFSGPDFLYAHAFFPNAQTYVLCGIEPIGALPEVASIPHEALAGSLALLRESLDPSLNFGFFISKKMRAEFVQNRLSGTLPVLYVFLARAGCHVDDVRFVGIEKGALIEASTANPGVKITFTAADHAPQTLYYFTTDLSDGPVAKSGFLRWCDGLGEGPSFLKAASYLMHEGGFETVRNFLLNHSQTIVEDDSGIPLKWFAPAQWTLRFFGAYPGPIATFHQHTQPRLGELMQSSHPARLPFGFGYRWHAPESTLILATKNEPAAGSGAK